MIKQVIVMRKDLNMRKGKIAAQAAHASMMVLLKLMYKYIWNQESRYEIRTKIGSPLDEWLRGLFTKICVYVDSEEELKEIYMKAYHKDMLCAMVVDSGATEFKGVPTLTCCAIGPDESEKIDVITGHLKLL